MCFVSQNATELPLCVVGTDANPELKYEKAQEDKRQT